MNHESTQVLNQRIDEARQLVPKGLYEHYKGDKYRVIGYCILEMTDEVAIQYSPLLEQEITWVRPLANWLEPVIVDNQPAKRFSSYY